MLIGALILFIGIVVGRLSSRLKPRAIDGEPKPICGCKHHYSMHDENGKCQFEEDYHWHKGERRSDTCPCQRYSGPEPLPKYIAGEL